MNIEDMEYGQKAMLWVYGRLNDLKEKGLVDGGSEQVTLRGVSVYDQLVATGFKPTMEDVVEIMGIMNIVTPEDISGVATLMFMED